MITTVDLSKARKYPRNKRAGKAMRILKEQISRTEEEFRVRDEVNRYIWGRGAQKPPKSVKVEIEPGDPATVSLAEQEEESEDTGSVSAADADYSFLDGTVAEAKDAVKEMDSPEIDSIMEAERAGKDRKTLVEWLESRME